METASKICLGIHRGEELPVQQFDAGSLAGHYLEHIDGAVASPGGQGTGDGHDYHGAIVMLFWSLIPLEGFPGHGAKFFRIRYRPATRRPAVPGLNSGLNCPDGRRR